jgi:hypothetical protein
MEAMGTGSRPFVGRYFALILDGYDTAGYLKAIEGGGIKGELLAQQVGGMPYRVKHINNPTIEPITVQVPFSMSAAFYDWVSKSWKGECERRSGSIVTLDFDLNTVHEWSFREALILETTIPTLDGSSKDPAYMTVKFQAETAEHKLVSSGPKVTAKSPGSQTMWLPSNFKLEIDGLDVQRVGKIDSFTLKQNVKPFTTGPDWMYQIEPTSLEYPNLSVYVALSNAEPWFTWHKEFVVEGKNGPDKEKTGAITLIDSTLSQTLLTINLKSVGIVNISPDKADASGQDQVKRVKIELYVEEMDFVFP